MKIDRSLALDRFIFHRMPELIDEPDYHPTLRLVQTRLREFKRELRDALTEEIEVKP